MEKFSEDTIIDLNKYLRFFLSSLVIPFLKSYLIEANDCRHTIFPKRQPRLNSNNRFSLISQILTPGAPCMFVS